MKDVITSAPGKLMLFGEHAVVYNRPCIVTAVDLRVFVKVRSGNDGIRVISTRDDISYSFARQLLGKQHSYPKEVSFVMSAVEHFYSAYNLNSALEITTFGPKNSFGLGSSSAVTVAVIAALAKYFDVTVSPKQVFDLAYQSVLKSQQGKGSGFDVAAATFGGTLYFHTGGAQIEPLDVTDLPIVIAYSGKKVSTVNLVSEVSRLYNRETLLIDGIFNLMESIVHKARKSIAEKKWEEVGELASINQGLLDALGVNSPQLARLIFAAKESGAFGAKLSGAGGGDCMFAVISGDAFHNVAAALENAGGQLVDFPYNAEGVREEKEVKPYV